MRYASPERRICRFSTVTAIAIFLPSVGLYFLRNALESYAATATIICLAAFSFAGSLCYLDGWAKRVGAFSFCAIVIPFLMYFAGLLGYVGIWGFAVWLAFLFIYLRRNRQSEAAEQVFARHRS